MRDNVPSEFNDRFRKISARLRVANERPVFSEFPAQENPYHFVQFAQYTGPTIEGQTEVYQLGLAAGSSELATAGFVLTDEVQPLARSFGGMLGDFIPGTPLTENHRAVAYYDGTLVGALNGRIYKSNLTGSWTQIIDLIDAETGIVPEISLAGLSASQFAAATVYASSKVGDRCELMIFDTNGGLDRWQGYLPKHTHRPGLAAYLDGGAGNYHLYVDDWSGKKPVHICRYAWRVWGATGEILPMDALDDESAFRVGYVTKLANGRVFLTGVLKRKYGPAYSVYLVGPDKFTFGRDMVIKAGCDRPLMIAEGEGRIWAVGKDDVFSTPLAPGIFSDLEPTVQSDIIQFNLDMVANGADRLSLNMPVSELEAHAEDLAAGAMLDLDVRANDQTITLGRFGIDRFRKMTSQEGQSFQVDCSSYTMKKLMDWESDTYFDYMGQGEAHGDPGDLTKLVRFSGGKYTSPAAGGLQLDSLNDDGMLYTAVPASHGGFIRCKFTTVQTSDNMLGVGLNYGEESLAEAARRLKKKVEQVSAGERGRWALIAVYVPDPLGAPAGTGRLYLMDYNTIRIGNAEDPTVRAPWRMIASANVTRPAAGGTMILGMQYQDGYARVYYANYDSPSLQLVISIRAALHWDLHPTEHENYGRGLVFMRNNTGFHMSYPVPSDSDVIPLYTALEKNKKYGVPIEDRTDKFPTMSGFVKIDSEVIQYNGIAGLSEGKSTWADLQWLPGKVIAAAGDGINTPAGTDTDFASSRGSGSPHVHGNNYVLQSFSAADGTALTAVRVWLKKVNFPEDGVTLSINQGNVGSSASAVALVNNVRVYGSSLNADQLKTEGGWVMFYLDRDLIVENKSGQQYWIMLRRNKNANHPSSTSYFQYKKMADTTYGSNGCYVFCEEDDQVVGQSGDMAFVLYANPDGANKEFMFPVQWQSSVGLPETDPGTYWNGCALTITKGEGINNCYRIVRSFRVSDSLNNIYVFCLDRNPGKIFGSATKARAMPAFYDLKRGQSGTTAAAHGGQSMVHKTLAGPVPLAQYFEYYTADEDLTLAEVAEEIARKAGVLDVEIANRHPGSVQGVITPGFNYEGVVKIPAKSKNCIVRMDVPLLGGDFDQAVVTFFDSEGYAAMAVQFVIGQNHLGTRYGFAEFWYYNLVLVNGDYQTDGYQALTVPFNENVKGAFRVSLYDGHLSAWIGGRIVGAVHLGANLKAWSSVGCWLVQATPDAPMKVTIPQSGTRVDNFVMDMGKTGSALLTSLIGEKRVYFRDDGAGRLKIYTDRETVPGAYNRALGLSTETTDIGLATRVLLEGGEVVEVSSAGNLEKYGNFFKTFNFHEINNLDDAQYFAEMVLEDMSLNREKVEMEGAADPEIEPTDIITIQFPDGSLRSAVVDSVSHSMYVDEQEAVYDMRLSGRFLEVA